MKILWGGTYSVYEEWFHVATISQTIDVLFVLKELMSSSVSNEQTLNNSYQVLARF